MSKEFGSLLMNRRNAAKYSHERLAELSELDLERVKKLEAGDSEPTLSELENLAEAMIISPKDLMLRTKDTTNGIKIVTAEESKESRRLINRQAEGRESKLYYSYQDTAFTTAAPHVRGVILDIMCQDEKDVVQNNGHFQDAITIITKGPIFGYWPNQKGEQVRRLLEEGHSYFARGFAPHTYRSPDNGEVGQILSFTFAQHLQGDAQDELMLLGEDRAEQYVMSNSPWGNLLVAYRNNSLLTSGQLSKLSGVLEAKILAIENGEAEPLHEEVLRFAQAMHISPSELMPTVSDAPYGTMHCTPEDSLKTKRNIEHYEVCDLAKSTEMSALRAHRMKTGRGFLEGTSCKLQSSQHTMIFMYKGRGVLHWEYDGKQHKQTLNNYDSVYIEPFIKHDVNAISVFASENEHPDFFRIQYPTHLSGDASKELYHEGKSGARRIAKEAGEWAKGQSQH